MIKITKNTDPAFTCKCCSCKYDLYRVSFGKNESATETILLCPECRKQLSSMLTKRVK